MKNHLNRIICFVTACLLIITSMDMSVFASENITLSQALKDYKSRGAVIAMDGEELVEDIGNNENVNDEPKGDGEHDDSVVEDFGAASAESIEELAETSTEEAGDSATKSTASTTKGIADEVIEDIIDDEALDIEDLNEYESSKKKNSTDGGEDAEDDESDSATKSTLAKSKRNYNVKLSGDVRNRIVQYANSLGGYFESPYIRSGMTLAWQCCAYVNQVWWDVFGVDLYTISDSAKNTYSEDGESAYEFFERVGVKSGDVIYTRYQKYKKNKRGAIVRDDKGNPVKAMGQHFMIILDYNEEYVWYTDGYESRTRGFIVSSIDKHVKYSESKYFRNLSGAYADIDGAYYAKAGKYGTRFRYYRLPEYVWVRAGGDAGNNVGKTNTLKSMATLSASESSEVLGGVSDLWISGLDEEGYEYNGEEITPEVKLYDNFKPVSEDEYVVEYSDNVNAGQATVWVTTITEPIGTISANFIIKPYDLEAHYNAENPEASDVSIKMPAVIRANGINKIKPLVTCMVGEHNTDELSVSENTISENSVSENSVSGNIISKNSIYDEVEEIASDSDIENLDITSDDGLINKKKITLKNNKSCVFTYPGELSTDELSSEGNGDEDFYLQNIDSDGNAVLAINIEGIGNFTGTIHVESDVRVVSSNKKSEEGQEEDIINRQEEIKEQRIQSRLEEVHRRLESIK